MNINEVKVVPVIVCNKEVRGTGTNYDPVRKIEQIYDLDGNLIMEKDIEIKYTLENIKKAFYNGLKEGNFCIEGTHYPDVNEEVAIVLWKKYCENNEL